MNPVLSSRHSMLYVLILTLIVITSCRKDVKESLPEIRLSNNVPLKVLEYFAENGFDTTKATMNDSCYVIEGDIAFKKSMIAENMKARKLDQNGRYSYESLIAGVNETNVTIRLSGGLSGNERFEAALNDVSLAYNQVFGSRINIIYDGSNPFTDVVVTEAGLGPNICGQGTWPSSGSAGSTISIDLDEVEFLNHEQLVFLLAHELGHNLGLRHSDVPYTNNLIPNTLEFDPNSIMRSNTCGFSFSNLTSSDVTAIEYLYPLITGSYLSNAINGPGDLTPGVTYTFTSGAHYAVFQWRVLNENDQLVFTLPSTGNVATWTPPTLSGWYYIECLIVNPKAPSFWTRKAVNF